MLDWKRARKDETDLSKRRIFETRCKSYWVVQAVGKFTDMGTVWYAISCLPNQSIISTHRAKGPAQNACEYHLHLSKTTRPK